MLLIVLNQSTHSECGPHAYTPHLHDGICQFSAGHASTEAGAGVAVAHIGNQLQRKLARIQAPLEHLQETMERGVVVEVVGWGGGGSGGENMEPEVGQLVVMVTERKQHLADNARNNSHPIS